MNVYADAERLLIRYLTGAFPTARVGVEMDDQLASALPAIWVQRIGGGEQVLSLDTASVDVDCFAATRLAANDFAAQVRTALTRGAVGYFDPDHTVSIARLTVQNFGGRPYANTNVRSVGMTADITLHNHS